MILSRSADYGMRAMVYLASHEGADYVPLHDITGAMRTPPFLLAHILQRLVKGGLVASMKGHHGGFRLQRTPRDITVGQIVELIDGPVRAFDCSGNVDCGLAGDCSLLELFGRVETAVQQTLHATSLEEIARPYTLQTREAANVQFRPRAGGGM